MQTPPPRSSTTSQPLLNGSLRRLFFRIDNSVALIANVFRAGWNEKAKQRLNKSIKLFLSFLQAHTKTKLEQGDTHTYTYTLRDLDLFPVQLNIAKGARSVSRGGRSGSDLWKRHCAKLAADMVQSSAKLHTVCVARGKRERREPYWRHPGLFCSGPDSR